MRRLLLARDRAYVAPESNLEARFESVLRRAGVAVPSRLRAAGFTTLRVRESTWHRPDEVVRRFLAV